MIVDLGPAYPLGPIVVHRQSGAVHRGHRPDVPPPGLAQALVQPVPFTQKQLREDLEALAKRYRALGYLGVRVTSDFSVQRSVDRAAKNVRLGVHISERKRIVVAFEGNSSQSSSALRDQLTLVTRGAYDDYEVGASADALQR